MQIAVKSLENVWLGRRFRLTRGGTYTTLCKVMRTYSTAQVAELVGIHRVTLQAWLSAGKVRASRSMRMIGRTLRRWTDTDVKRVKKYKAAHYWEGRGVKKKSKA